MKKVLFLALIMMSSLMAEIPSKGFEITWSAKVISREIASISSLTCFYIDFEEESTPTHCERGTHETLLVIPSSQSDKIKADDNLLFIFSHHQYFLLNKSNGEIFYLYSPVDLDRPYWLAHPLQSNEKSGLVFRWVNNSCFLV